MKHLRYALIAFGLLFAPHAEAATCFAVGTNLNPTWSTSNLVMWASSSGGTASTCAATGGVPKQAADTAIFDGSSGGGTVTVDTTINGVTLTQITTSAFTGTINFSTNNPSITLSTAWTDAGTGVHTISLGSGTFTFTGIGTFWNFTASANTTLNAGTSTIFSEPANPLNSRTFAMGGFTYATVRLGNNNGISNGNLQVSISGTGTIGTLLLDPPLQLAFSAAVTITSAVNWNGTSASNIITILNTATQHTVTLTNGGTMSWAVFCNTIFTGSPTATNSFNLGGVSGITITGPSGGGGGHIIGG